MNEDRYASCLAETRDVILAYLRKHDIVAYEYWLAQVVGMPECVPMMIREVLSGLEAQPVNYPALYRRGLFE